MPSTRPWLLLAILATAIAMTLAAHFGARGAAAAAAAMASAALIAAAVIANRSSGEPQRDAALAVHAAENARLMSRTYNWGGLSMLLVYQLSGLKWQHGWQYGLGMVLIALALHVYARRLATPQSQLAERRALDATAYLALAQGIAAAVALVVLFASGKIGGPKNDWAANHIFVAGGLAIVVISFLAFATHRRLGR